MSDRTYYSRTAEERANRERLTTAMLLIAMSVGVGAALAVLFAPKSGKDMREELGSTLNDGFRNGRDTTTSAIHQLQKDFADLRKKVEDRVTDMR